MKPQQFSHYLKTITPQPGSPKLPNVAPGEMPDPPGRPKDERGRFRRINKPNVPPEPKTGASETPQQKLNRQLSESKTVVAGDHGKGKNEGRLAPVFTNSSDRGHSGQSSVPYRDVKGRIVSPYPNYVPPAEPRPSPIFFPTPSPSVMKLVALLKAIKNRSPYGIALTVAIEVITESIFNDSGPLSGRQSRPPIKSESLRKKRESVDDSKWMFPDPRDPNGPELTFQEYNRVITEIEEREGNGLDVHLEKAKEIMTLPLAFLDP